MKIKSAQRIEMANLENRLDEDHAKQLEEDHAQVADQAQDKLNELERETIAKMQEEGRF